MKKKIILLGLIAGLAMGAKFIGEIFQFTKTTALPTCALDRLGSVTSMLGGSGEGATKLCICGSDGAASPAYAWCSITVTGTSAVVCAGGSTTVCP